MKYYKRGKASLEDDIFGEFKKYIDSEIAKLPVDQQYKALREHTKQLYDNLDDILEEMANDVLKAAKRDIKETIKADENDRKRFESRLYKKYKPVIDAYTELLGVCIDAVDSHRDIIHKNIGEKDPIWPDLLRLHARIHRIANEILALMRSGYGTGALSRWRSMHETSVVLAYVIQHGPRAIKLMRDHEAVSSYKAMRDYQFYHKKLNATPYSSYEMNLAKRKYDRRVRRYGHNFKQDYGWVSIITPHVHNFRELEKDVGVDHLRPYYKMSSKGVHTEWSSLFTGEEHEALQKHGIILIGPADYGFYDAVSLAMITVSHATTMILTYNQSMKSLMYAKAIRIIQQRGEEKLIRVDAKIRKGISPENGI